ncbi:hypothetical protein B0H14DRAFT_2755153 [Mycena olivaceomarginata]|nr:hypothetical protein B0H14DRAFT_2755153 [Mycena olivaceomarginata]
MKMQQSQSALILSGLKYTHSVYTKLLLPRYRSVSGPAGIHTVQAPVATPTLALASPQCPYFTLGLPQVQDDRKCMTASANILNVQQVRSSLKPDLLIKHVKFPTQVLLKIDKSASGSRASTGDKCRHRSLTINASAGDGFHPFTFSQLGYPHRHSPSPPARTTHTPCRCTNASQWGRTGLAQSVSRCYLVFIHNQ